MEEKNNVRAIDYKAIMELLWEMIPTPKDNETPWEIAGRDLYERAVLDARAKIRGYYHHLHNFKFTTND